MFGAHNDLQNDKHFQQEGHDFNTHAKFTFIEKFEKPASNKIKKRRIMELKEDNWMKRKTITPYGLNVGYNHPHDISGCIN